MYSIRIFIRDVIEGNHWQTYKFSNRSDWRRASKLLDKMNVTHFREVAPTITYSEFVSAISNHPLYKTIYLAILGRKLKTNRKRKKEVKKNEL